MLHFAQLSFGNKYAIMFLHGNSKQYNTMITVRTFLYSHSEAGRWWYFDRQYDFVSFSNDSASL